MTPPCVTKYTLRKGYTPISAAWKAMVPGCSCAVGTLSHTFGVMPCACGGSSSSCSTATFTRSISGSEGTRFQQHRAAMLCKVAKVCKAAFFCLLLLLLSQSEKHPLITAFFLLIGLFAVLSVSRVFLFFFWDVVTPTKHNAKHPTVD